MKEMKLCFTQLKDTYSICRLNVIHSIPEWVYQSEMFSITKTLEELSIVCCQKFVPDDVKQERDFRVIKVKGPLDFSLIGILASISSILANKGISIFVISTYDTDYILVKEKNWQEAVKALTMAGHIVE